MQATHKIARLVHSFCGYSIPGPWRDSLVLGQVSAAPAEKNNSGKIASAGAEIKHTTIRIWSERVTTAPRSLAHQLFQSLNIDKNAIILLMYPIISSKYCLVASDTLNE